MPLTASETVALYVQALRLARRLAVRIEQAGMSTGDLEVLAIIDANPDITPTDVSTALGRATPTISHVLTRLADAGLITRTVSSLDKRARTLALTSAGRTALAHAFADLDPLPARAGGSQLLAKLRRAADHA